MKPAVPAALASMGLGLVTVFLAFHALGLRAGVGVLSGTLPMDEVAVAGGVLYALAWFGAVIAAPILCLGAAIHAAAGALRRRLA